MSTGRTSEKTLQAIQKALSEQATVLEVNNLCAEGMALISQITSLQALTINHYAQIPDSFANLTQLRQLHLQHGTEQAVFPAVLLQLTQLQQLRFCHHAITQLPEGIAQLTQLTALDLSHNQLQTLPDTIGALQQLQTLHVAANQLYYLPYQIGQLQALQVLRLNDNQLKGLPMHVCQLAQLSQLDVSNNQLKSLSATLRQLPLRQVHITGNPLYRVGNDFPACIAESESKLQRYLLSDPKIVTVFLVYEQQGEAKFWEGVACDHQVHLSYGNANRCTHKTFTLDNAEQAQADLLKRQSKKQKEGYQAVARDSLERFRHQLDSLQQAGKTVFRAHAVTDEQFALLCEYRQLEQIELTNCRISVIPDAIANLTQLVVLELNCEVPLQHLSEQLNQLHQLRYLTIKYGALRRLPDLSGLNRLRTLRVTHNQLSELPQSLGTLSALTRLDLQENQLTDLPDSLAQLTQLQDLDLSHNQLQQLPAVIGNISALDELDVSYNQLTQLPDSIGQLTTLTELDLRGNQLTGLPDTLVQLADTLETLDLNNNQLPEVPELLLQLKNLDTLYLGENCFGDCSLYDYDAVQAYFAKQGRAAVAAVAPTLYVDPQGPIDVATRRDIATQYQTRIKAWEKETRYSCHTTRDAIVQFICGETDFCPPCPSKVYDDFDQIMMLFNPVTQWTFIEQRLLAFITQESWLQKKGTYDHGFHSKFLAWLAPQIAQEVTDPTLSIADRVLSALADCGIDDTEHLIYLVLNELHEQLILSNGQPSSFGRFLCQQYDQHIDTMLQIVKGYIYQYDLAELFALCCPDKFDAKLDALLFADRDDAPHQLLSRLVKSGGERYLPHVQRALAMPKSCVASKMAVQALLFQLQPDVSYPATLAMVRETLNYLVEQTKRKSDYAFAWDGSRWRDNRNGFIRWALQHFGAALIDDLDSYVNHTWQIDLALLEIIADYLGQTAVPILAHGLNMSDQGDALDQHFERLYALLNRFDCHDLAEALWSVLAFRSDKVKRLTAHMLARLGDASRDRALQWMEQTDPELRYQALLVLQHFTQQEPIKIVFNRLKFSEFAPQSRAIILAHADLTLDDVKQFVQHCVADKNYLKPVKPWLALTSLPTLYWQWDDSPVAQEMVQYLFYSQKAFTTIELAPEVALMVRALRQDSRHAFAQALYQQIMDNGGCYAKNRFVLGLLGAMAGPDTLTQIQHIAIQGKNLNAVETLGCSQETAAVVALDAVVRKFSTKYPNVREAAEQALQQIATARGVSLYQLQDMTIPDFGFQGHRLPIRFADQSYEAFIDSDRQLKLRDVQSGKVSKTPPKAASDAEKQQFKALKSQVTTTTKEQLVKLEIALVLQRKWSKTEWENLFLAHPLMSVLARHLVWGIYVEDTLLDAFRITRHTTFVTAESRTIQMQTQNWESDFWHFLGMYAPKPIELRQKQKPLSIGLVHPIQLSAAQRQQWQIMMRDAPIAQMTRACHVLDAAQQQHTILQDFCDQPIQRFAFDRLGWRRGSVVDTGTVSSYKKRFDQFGLEAFIEVEGVNVQHFDDIQKLGRLYFVESGSVYTGSYIYDEPKDEADPRLYPLSAVPAVIFSEVMADLTYLTDTTSETTQ